jgi:acetyl-CoA carboxylase biotin carboxylase subunit
MPEKVLVANRGEIALRIMRACREEGISTVAVHSDVDSESLHVKMADESVCIGPARPAESYLNIHALLSAAEITNAIAIHPAYGFLSENADFADTCRKGGFQFIGPTSKSIRMMGDKIQARKAMEAAGLPVLPGGPVDFNNKKKVEKLVEKIGLPLIIKAVHGGGGRGMKVIHDPSQIWTSLETARAESEAAFGKATVYLEKFLPSSKHIEFQIAADKKGNVVCFGERDCTVQRRYQKLIEETPSPALTKKKREEIIPQICKAMKKIGYTSLGTVEFLADSQNNLYFLEMNTRLQVEHPVTEMATGIDLVKLQINIADGHPLPFKQEDIQPTGHVIECRINAEDPEKFLPSTGTIDGYHVPGGFNVRVDSALYEGYSVLPYYDSLLAKVIVKDRDRGDILLKTHLEYPLINSLDPYLG